MSTVKISFWRIFWPSFVASIVLSILGWMFWIFVLASMFAPPPSTKDSRILKMTLHGAIAERSNNSFTPASLSTTNTIGLSDILAGLKQAKKDKFVDGIYLDLGNIQCGYATAMEIRKGLEDFKSSGKFLIAFLSGEVVTQKQYYVSSVADKLYGFSNSTMEFIGLGGELMFFKNTFDKLGIEMQVIRGSNNDFKSAVEPYFRTSMSDSSRLQTSRYMTSIWNTILKDISKSRNVDVATLNTIAEDSKIMRLGDAKQYKLIDDVKYRDEVEEIVLAKSKLKNLDNAMTFESYVKTSFKNEQLAFTNKIEKPNIAVIVGEGAITVDGDELTSEKICSYFREVRKNEGIKTVVFRVNSPGGSALASEEIWREVTLTAKKKKVIVSMGDVAASGGYYISTPASVIFAEPTTITGSIGVFGVIPYIGDFMENKLGLTFDRVQTNKHSVLSLNKRLTEEELKIIQQNVDDTYLLFKTRVADGRKLSLNRVQEIARGRVWTGEDALKIGLVDKLGGFNDALAYAMKNAKITNPKVQYFPKVQDKMIDEVFKMLEEEGESIQTKQQVVPKILDDITKRLMKLESYSGIQMRLPFEITLN